MKLNLDKSSVTGDHTFHIPVMGTGYTADSPLKIARYGISSVLSLVDDILLDQIRHYYCDRENIPFVEIDKKDDNARSKRVTAYLNLLDVLIERDTELLRRSPFEPGSEITRYFEMLPDGPARQLYHKMLETEDREAREAAQDKLRGFVKAGSIDVNIMTKIDRFTYKDGERRASEYSDALTALKGFAESTISGAMVFSAGTNPRLFGYLSSFKDFFPDEQQRLKKRIILKVSDYRSALVQSKFLARSGLWVSEIRIEASLNCGGHAFATEGLLLGPILEEFKNKPGEISKTVTPAYFKSLAAKGYTVPDEPPTQRLTVQGGIGTAAEDTFMRSFYGADGTGWATPFMLVPEVVNVDEEHLAKLADATDDDVYISDSSPLSVSYWMLRGSQSENARIARIAEGKPGSACPKGFLYTSSEFTERPICLASRLYQKKKLEQLEKADLSKAQRDRMRQKVLDKACICHELGGCVTRNLGINTSIASTVCCGPNIVNFSRTATLEEMIDHIYGRGSLLTNADRPHVFIRDLMLYVDELKKEIYDFEIGLSERKPVFFTKFYKNISEGIAYYRDLVVELPEQDRDRFIRNLNEQAALIDKLMAQYLDAAAAVGPAKSSAQAQKALVS